MVKHFEPVAECVKHFELVAECVKHFESVAECVKHFELVAECVKHFESKIGPIHEVLDAFRYKTGKLTEMLVRYEK